LNNKQMTDSAAPLSPPTAAMTSHLSEAEATTLYHTSIPNPWGNELPFESLVETHGGAEPVQDTRGGTLYWMGKSSTAALIWMAFLRENGFAAALYWDMRGDGPCPCQCVVWSDRPCGPVTPAK